MLIMKPESPAFFFGKFERYSTILGCGLMARRCAVNADDDGSNPSIPALILETEQAIYGSGEHLIP